MKIRNKPMKKNELHLRNVIAIAICLAVTTVFSGCDKENPEYGEFCSYANVDDFHKTAPIINEYLSSLPNSMSNERKLQVFTEWLCSQPCIISAKLESAYTLPNDSIICRDGPCPPGTSGIISILLDDNGITRELTLSIWGDKSKPMKASAYSYMKPKEVRVAFKSDSTTIRDIFNFINLFDHKVLSIYRAGAGRGYLSIMPASSLEDILKILNAKPYFSRVHGYVLSNRMDIQAANYRFSSAHIDSYIVIDETMSNMENKDYQADWLKFMNDYKFFEGNTHHAWFMIDFDVPDGKEREWIEKFKTYESVIWATLNHGYGSMEEI
jgi:hypothetical protein